VSRVKFLDRLLIIGYCQLEVMGRNKSYHFGLLNGFKYWYCRMHESTTATSCHLGVNVLVNRYFLNYKLSNGTERQLKRVKKQFMRNVRVEKAEFVFPPVACGWYNRVTSHN
jgi:hypothetical protein